MLPIVGTQIHSLPRQLVFVRDLEAFEGPILTELKPAVGTGVYVEKWCARDECVSRWLVVRSEQRSVAEYLGGQITLLDLLQESSDGIGFLWDRRGGNSVEVSIVTLSSLPDNYMPKPGARHDRSLRPAWNDAPQSFLLDESWNPRIIALTEKRYLDATAFAYHTRPGTDRALPLAVQHYVMDRGFPIATAFREMRAAVPTEYRAKTVGVAASSPGVLTLNAPAAVARDLSDAIVASADAADAYAEVFEWSKISPKNVDRMPDVAYAQEKLSVLCSRLRVSMSAVLPSTDPTAVLRAGKLVAAYYRKLRQLVDGADGSKFLGAPNPQENPEEEDDE